MNEMPSESFLDSKCDESLSSLNPLIAPFNSQILLQISFHLPLSLSEFGLGSGLQSRLLLLPKLSPCSVLSPSVYVILCTFFTCFAFLFFSSDIYMSAS
jgi:hypothetical protein